MNVMTLFTESISTPHEVPVFRQLVRVSELANGSEPNAVTYQKESDGTQTINEITGKNQTLKFGTEASTGNQGAAQ